MDDEDRQHNVADEIEPPKKKFGLPYNWQRPTKARAKSGMWNEDDPRLFPPKSFGAGWTVNFYWLFHLPSYFAKRKATQGPR